MASARDEFLAALVVATAAMAVVNDKFEAYEAEKEREELRQSHRAISDPLEDPA